MKKTSALIPKLLFRFLALQKKYLSCNTISLRLYSARCSACKNTFTRNDFVMRAKTQLFHLECFRCSACTRHLGKRMRKTIKKFDESIRGITGRRKRIKRLTWTVYTRSQTVHLDCTAREVYGIRAYAAR
jgi:hypothetical protein